jgi:hypothetical protein
MYPRFTRAILILLILAITVSVLVPAVPAAGTTRVVPAFAPATTTPAPVKTVTCAAPCQCLAYNGAVGLWGEGGFSQCAELPCQVSQSVTGAPVELYCYRQKQPAVPTTTTPAQVLIPRGRITPIPTTVMQVLVPQNLTTTTPVPVQHQAIVPVNPSIQQVRAPLDLCHYDPAKNQCAGICPQTGKACMQIKESSCGNATGEGSVTCGCVDTKSPASLAASGLARTDVLSHTEYHAPPAPPKGIVDSTLQLIPGLGKKTPDLSSANPRAYTEDTRPGAGVLFSGLCPGDLFRTTLIFADRDTAFISTDTGTQKGSFSWDTADPRVRTAVWQVSIFPFPQNANNWSNVPGLLAQGNLEGDDRTFSIDFSKSVPTAADSALVWTGKRAFLTVQKNALNSMRTDLLTSHTNTPGINTAVLTATRQKQAADIDTALVKINNRIAAPAAYTLVSPSKSGSLVSYNANLSLGLAGGGAKASGTLSPTYVTKGGVLAPVLSAPSLTKAGIAGSLPQNQRTLFVRVVPFDQYGNYTNNPSNTKEVVIGSPRFNVTSPWSGWEARSAPDLTGFTGQPETVNSGDRIYLFNVRSDHQVYMSSLDDKGSSPAWVPVPGAPQTDTGISAVAIPKLGTYLFVSSKDTGLIWYASMDTAGTWSSWKQVPQKNTAYHYELKKALVLDGDIYLMAQYDYRKYHPEDMAYVHPSASYVYQLMNQPDYLGGSWMKDWVDTSVSTGGSSGKIAGSSNRQLIVGAFKDGSDQPHFIMYSTTGALTVKNTIDVPPEILNAKTSVDDLAATSYHGRIYYFVRGKAGHIFMNWATIMNPMGSTEYVGELHDWVDISPDKMTASSGIMALPSPEGDRLDVFANNIQNPDAESTGGLGFLLSFFFAPQSTGMHRNSLGGAPDNTQMLSSFYGDKSKKFMENAYSGYRPQDINVSWDRTTPYWFAWNSSRPDLYYAEWQVSATPFDEIHPLFNDKGIVSRGRLSVSGTDPDFVMTGYEGISLPGYTDKVHLFPVNFHNFATAYDPNNPSITRYYLRVLAVAPADGPGSYTAYVSEQTEVDWGKQDEFVPKFCTPPTFYYYNYQLPNVRFINYTPMHKRDENSQCYYIATTGREYWIEQYLKNPTPFMLTNPTYVPAQDAEKFATLMVGDVKYGWGKNVCEPPADKSWWDKLMDGISDFFSLLAETLNNFADIYNSTKASVIAACCGGSSACVTIVSAGVDIGLAALGVPPTIPNFDQLMNEGAGYLAATIADESGVPGTDIIAKEAITQMASSMKNVPSSRDAYGSMPDPQYQYQSARVLIELRNDDPVNTTPPGSFRFEDSQGLFKTMQPDTPFPSLAPGQVVTFPLILREDQWKGMTCTESFAGGNEYWTVPCDEMYAGEVSHEWWSRYQNAAAGGDSFALYYDGMTANFTRNITERMESQYDVPLDTYNGAGWQQDFTSPDCFAEKHQLVFRQRITAAGKFPMIR